ncbi:hypothetical protein AVEN_138784-1, partial [Araneus ventricosus]
PSTAVGKDGICIGVTQSGRPFAEGHLPFALPQPIQGGGMNSSAFRPRLRRIPAPQNDESTSVKSPVWWNF